MSQDEFDKLYFKAKLIGKKAIGELMIKLIYADEEEFAFELVRKYSPGAIKAPAVENVSLDRPCNWSPYGYCFTNTLGQTIIYTEPESIYCIWCERIYIIDETDPESNYIPSGKIISGDNM